MKESCGIKLEQRLENEAVEKASVKGDVPQVAMDLQERASVYDWHAGYVLKWMIKASHLCLGYLSAVRD